MVIGVVSNTSRLPSYLYSSGIQFLSSCTWAILPYIVFDCPLGDVLFLGSSQTGIIWTARRFVSYIQLAITLWAPQDFCNSRIRPLIWASFLLSAIRRVSVKGQLLPSSIAIANARAHILADWHRVRLRWHMDLGSRGREGVLIGERAMILQLCRLRA